MNRSTAQQRELIPKPKPKRIVKRPKGDAEKKQKEVAEKMKKVIKKPKGDAERKKKEVESKSQPRARIVLDSDAQGGGKVFLNVGDEILMTNLRYKRHDKDGDVKEFKPEDGYLEVKVTGIKGDNVSFTTKDLKDETMVDYRGKVIKPYSHTTRGGKRTFVLTKKQLDSDRKGTGTINAIIKRA